MADDFINNPTGPYKARGVLLEHIKDSNGHTLPGTTLVALPFDGPDAGCDVRLLDDQESYTYSFLSMASANDNIIVGFWPGDVLDSVQVGVYPAVSVDETFTVSASAVWNSVIAGVQAIRRSKMGLSSEWFEFVAEPCTPGSGSSCFKDGQLHIHPDHSSNKHVIVHEVGHQMSTLVTGFLPGGVNWDGAYDLLTGDAECPGDLLVHGLGTVEHQQMAIWEGMASYYSAIAFNSTGSGANSCVRASAKDDVMGDCFCFHAGSGCGEEFVNDHEYHCDTFGNQHEDDDLDYMGERCTTLVASGIENAATEYDWQRTFWDMTTKPYNGATFTPGGIFGIIGDSNPSGWSHAAGVGPGDPGHPPSDLIDAAVANGVGAHWGARTLFQGVSR